MPQTGATDRGRKWRWLLIVEINLVTGLIALSRFGIDCAGDCRWVAASLTLLWLGWALSLPLRVAYFFEQPINLSLSPLIPSPESRAFRKELKERPARTDEEFFAEFYAKSAISITLTSGVRRSLAEFDSFADRLIPSDYLPLLDDELDLAWVLDWVGREFEVRFTRADYPEVDGTLDNLIRLTHARVEQHFGG